MVYENDYCDSDDESMPTPAEIKAMREARFEENRKQREAMRLLPKPPPLPPNEYLWVDPAQQKQWDGRLKELADHVRFFSDPSNPVPEPDHGRPCYVKEIAYRDVAGNAAKKRSRSEY